MKQNAHDIQTEQLKSMLDGIPQEFIAELAEPQIDGSQLAEDAEVVTAAWGTPAPHTRRMQKPDKPMSRLLRTVTTFGGIAAALLAVIGISAILRSTPPEIGGTSEVSEEINIPYVTTAPLSADEIVNSVTASPKKTEPTKAVAVTDVPQQIVSQTVEIPTATVPADHPAEKNPVTKYTDPQWEISFTPKYSTTAPVSTSKLTVEKVKQIIAENSSFEDMYKKICAIQMPDAHWGSGIDYQLFYLNADGTEYIEIMMQQYGEISYFLNKQRQVLYQEKAPNAAQLQNTMDEKIAAYLKSLGYTDSDFAKIKNAKFDISSCRVPQIAVAFVTYLETQYYNPITHDELQFFFDSDTTDYVGWSFSNRVYAACTNFDPITDHIDVQQELKKTDDPVHDLYDGKLTFDFNSGYNWCEQYSICNLHFLTTNIDDIQLDGTFGMPHVMYLCDFDGDRYWTYQDLCKMYRYVVDKEYYLHGAIGPELISVDILDSVLPENAPAVTMQSLCQVLAGKANSLV